MKGMDIVGGSNEYQSNIYFVFIDFQYNNSSGFAFFVTA